MRREIIVAAAAIFVIVAVQPAVAQPADNNTVPDVDIDSDNETEDEEGPENETEEEQENETDREQEREGPPETPGKSAQFDARLMTAINTVDALVEMAPDSDSKQRLEEALTILKGVQEDTETASLGPENTSEQKQEKETAQEREGEAENQSQAPVETGEQGPTEEVGPSGNQGPSENSNRPGFVDQLIGGIFG